MTNAPPPSEPQGLSPRAQGALVAVIALVALIGGFSVRLVVAPWANQPENAATRTQPGSFRPTKEQWAGINVATVRAMTFRPERVTEGNIAVDDDLDDPGVLALFRAGHQADRQARRSCRARGAADGGRGDRVRPGAERPDHRRLDPEDRALSAQPGADRRTAPARFSFSARAPRSKTGSRARPISPPRRTMSAPSRDRAAGGAQPPAHPRQERRGDRRGSRPARRRTWSRSPSSLAPIGGTVTQRQVGLGQNIHSVQSGASTPVYTIGDLSTVWLSPTCARRTPPLIRVGEPVEVRVLAFPGRVFKARISWVAPSIDANTHRLPVRADVENPDGALKPLMFAQLQHHHRRRPAGRRRCPRTRSSTRATPLGSGSVRDNGAIASRVIRVGEASGGMVEVSGRARRRAKRS